MTLGGIVRVIALLLVAWSPSLWAFYGAWLVAGFAQSAIFYPPAFAVITRWYGTRRVQPMVDVAERAGVSRKTLYRWWPSHEDVLVEGLSRHVRQVAPPDTGAWESDVRGFAHLVATFAAAPVKVATSSLMASRRYPEFSALVVAQYAPARREWQRMVDRAAERGKFSPNTQPRR